MKKCPKIDFFNQKFVVSKQLLKTLNNTKYLNFNSLEK